MKTRFQIFKAPFYFVRWQAPAYRDIQSQRDHKRLKGFKEKSLLLTLWSLLSCRLKPVFKSIGASIWNVSWLKSTFTFTLPVLERYIKTLPSTLVASSWAFILLVKYSLAAFTIGFRWSAFNAIAMQAVRDSLNDFTCLAVPEPSLAISSISTMCQVEAVAYKYYPIHYSSLFASSRDSAAILNCSDCIDTSLAFVWMFSRTIGVYASIIWRQSFSDISG